MAAQIELKDVECGNRAYTPVSADLSDIEGVQYLQLVVDLPSERCVPRMDGVKRTFYIWRPDSDSHWMPMPVSEIDRIRVLCYHNSAPMCGSDDEQNKHIGDMILMIEGDVVLVDE